MQVIAAGLKGQEVTRFTSSPSVSPFTVARSHGLVRHGAMRVVRWQVAGSLEVFLFFKSVKSTNLLKGFHLSC